MADEKVSHERARVVLQRLGKEAAPRLLIEAATLHLYIKQNETIAAQLAEAVKFLRETVTYETQPNGICGYVHDDSGFRDRLRGLLARIDAEKGG